MGPPLTPVSGHDGKVVAANILEGNNHKPDYRGVPSVAFTVPPIASVGFKESQAQAQGLKFKVKSENTPNWFTARLNGCTATKRWSKREPSSFQLSYRTPHTAPTFDRFSPGKLPPRKRGPI